MYPGAPAPSSPSSPSARPTVVTVSSYLLYLSAALIVLNGTALPRDQTLDQFVGPRDIAGIEWYDNEATAPRQYAQPTDAAFNICSVLMVWTKQYEVARRR